MARHETLALLDQAAQEPRLGRSRVGRLAEWEASGVVRVELRLVEPDAQQRQQLADAATLRRGREHGRRGVGVDDRRQLSVRVEAFGLDVGLAKRPKPSRLGHDVRRQDHDAPTRVEGRTRAKHVRCRTAEQALDAVVAALHQDAREARARTGQDDAAQQRKPGDRGGRRHAGRGGRLGRNDQ